MTLYTLFSKLLEITFNFVTQGDELSPHLLLLLTHFNSIRGDTALSSYGPLLHGK